MTPPKETAGGHTCEHEGDWGYMKAQLEKLDGISEAVDDLKREVIVLKTQRSAACWFIGVLSSIGGAGLMGLATKLIGGK